MTKLEKRVQSSAMKTKKMQKRVQSSAKLPSTTLSHQHYAQATV